jgi:hypothetical protein
MTVGRGEVQLPWQRSLQIGLKELDLPAAAVLKAHVYPVTFILGHGISIGEHKTNNIIHK